MTDYTWSILALDCKPDVNGMLDYVVISHWQCAKTDGDFSGYFCSATAFSVEVNKPNFIPFVDLTEEQVIQWTQDALGENQLMAVYDNVDTQIENQKKPPIITPPLPWLASNV